MTPSIKMKNKFLVAVPAATKLAYLSLVWVTASQLTLAQVPAPVVSGQGTHPAPEISGDTLTPPAVPTVGVFNSASSIFATQSEQIPLTIYLRTDTYSQNTHQFMGKRTVLTLRPNTLNAMQLDLVKGILQLDLSSAQTKSQPALWLDVSENQLEQLQTVIYPTSTNAVSNNQSLVSAQLFHYLPVVKRFARYAVLLGVVFATVLLAFATSSLVMGQRGSSEKIIGTGVGLIVLLLAFSIYNLLISNAANQSSSTTTLTSSTNTTPIQQR